MKKVLTILLGLFVISGCNSSPDWVVELVETPQFVENQASQVSFKITEGDKLVENLDVNAKFEMAKMDHGSIDVELADKGEGIYSGAVTLPMEGEWQAFLTISAENISSEEVIKFTVQKAKASSSGASKMVASINGENITTEDVEFYKLINMIQIEMYREADEKRYKDKELEEVMKYWDQQESAAKDENTLLTQIIRLRAMALLGEEKGHKATAEEIQEKLQDTKKAYENSPRAQKMIKEYGETNFWEIQEKQQEAIVLVSKVQQDVLNNVKKDNPKAESKEINMLAQKKYEELLVSQVSTLDIKINNS